MIAAPTETPDGRRIHKFDYRQEAQDCAHCNGDSDDDHSRLDHDFEPAPRTIIPCPQCGKTIEQDLYYGVYITRVAYLMFDSPLCAYEFDFNAAGYEK